MPQIHVAGAKRSGKTTLAKRIVSALEQSTFSPVLVDIDEVKVNIFGTDTGEPDTRESLRYHAWTREAIYNVIVPAVLKGNGLPVVVETHSNVGSYRRAEEISKRFGVIFKFLLLETPSFEEAARRAEQSVGDHSDMHDFNDPQVRLSWINGAAKIRKTYQGLESTNLCRIPQGTPEYILERALGFILPL